MGTMRRGLRVAGKICSITKTQALPLQAWDNLGLFFLTQTQIHERFSIFNSEL